MKKTLRFSFYFLILASTVLVSCTKTDSTPSPSGDDRTKFLGDWGVHEIHNKSDYTVTIRVDPNDASRIFIDNFANLIYPNKATAVISGNSITLDPGQVVSDWTIISGSGTMTGTTTINCPYAMTNGATRIDVTTATYTKK
jgi:hypothetical protein